VGGELRAALTSSPLATLGAMLARPGLRKFSGKLNPPRAAPFLGLNGVVVKCHGGAVDHDFADAIRMASDLAQSDFAVEIERNMKQLAAAVAESSPAPADGAA
jgi:glycerol-3-phosphate acyltransferase PlsX